MTDRKRCLISTAVWGDRHVDAFLRLNIPTLLAGRNLPAFAAGLDTSYLIYAPSTDRTRIERSEAFQRLAGLVDVEFVELTNEEIGEPIATHQRVWRRTIERARRLGSFVMLMPPDVLWSDGSLEHLALLVASGKSAIFLNWHLRAVSETFVPQFLTRYCSRPGDVAVTGRELVRLTLEHLHPMCGASLRDTTMVPHHPEMFFWPVLDQGVLMHVLALTPFLFNARSIAMTQDKLVAHVDSPDRLHVVSDSDDLYMVSLAELGKDSAWYRRNGRIDPVEIARWWLRFDSPANDHLATAPFRLRFDNSDPAAWRRAEQSASIFVRRLIQTRELYRVYRAARELGCRHAASLIAAAMYMGLAPHLMRDPEPVTVFLPLDSASNMAWPSVLDMLVDTTMRRQLIQFLRSHMVRSRYLSDDHQADSATTTRSEAFAAITIADFRPKMINGVPLVGAPRKAGRNTVFAAVDFLAHAVAEKQGAMSLNWRR